MIDARHCHEAGFAIPRDAESARFIKLGLELESGGAASTTIALVPDQVPDGVTGHVALVVAHDGRIRDIGTGALLRYVPGSGETTQERLRDYVAVDMLMASPFDSEAMVIRAAHGRAALERAESEPGLLFPFLSPDAATGEQGMSTLAFEVLAGDRHALHRAARLATRFDGHIASIDQSRSRHEWLACRRRGSITPTRLAGLSALLWRARLKKRQEAVAQTIMKWRP
jgi:hypothetical protein